MADAPGPPTSPEEIERRIRERAAHEGRGLDAVDAFLISMSRLLGVEATDRYIGTARPSS